MKRSAPSFRPLRVAFFAYPDVQGLDLSGPLEMFARATRLTTFAATGVLLTPDLRHSRIFCVTSERRRVKYFRGEGDFVH